MSRFSYLYNITNIYLVYIKLKSKHIYIGKMIYKINRFGTYMVEFTVFFNAQARITVVYLSEKVLVCKSTYWSYQVFFPAFDSNW